MKYILLSLLSLVMVGCTTDRQFREKAIREIHGCTLSEKGLYDAVSSYYQPKLKTCYEHGNNGYLKVFQSVKGGVLVFPTYNEWDTPRGNASKMNIFVETTDEYADEEILRSGYYEYVGMYEYTSIKKVNVKVRKFRKLPVDIKE
jgi:hypothetical protein